MAYTGDNLGAIYAAKHQSDMRQDFGDDSTAKSIISEPEFAKISERVQAANKRLDDEINFLGATADKLFGEQPEADRDPRCSPVRSGRVGDVLDGLDGLHDRLGRLSSVIHRLSNLA